MKNNSCSKLELEQLRKCGKIWFFFVEQVNIQQSILDPVLEGGNKHGNAHYQTFLNEFCQAVKDN